MKLHVKRAAVVVVPLLALVGVSSIVPAEPAPIPKSVEIRSTQRVICPAVPGSTGQVRVLGEGKGNLLSGPIGQPQLTWALGDLVLDGITEPHLLATDDDSAKFSAGFALSADQQQVWGGCGTTATQQTFVFTAGGSSTLHLVNPVSHELLVNVTIDTLDGELATPELLDLRVPANSTTEIDLGTIAGATGASSVRVQATDGEFFAYVVRSGAPDAEIVASSATNQRLVIPVGLGGASRSTLILSNSSTARTSASISVISSSGTFVPEGGTELSVEAGRTREIDLTSVSRDEPVAILITAASPISAALESWLGNDFAAVPAEQLSENVHSRELSVPVSGLGQLVLANPSLTEIEVVLTWDDTAEEQIVPASSTLKVAIPADVTTLRVTSQNLVVGGLIIGSSETGVTVARLQQGELSLSSLPIQVEPRLGNGR